MKEQMSMRIRRLRLALAVLVCPCAGMIWAQGAAMPGMAAPPAVMPGIAGPGQQMPGIVGPGQQMPGMGMDIGQQQQAAPTPTPTPEPKLSGKSLPWLATDIETTISKLKTEEEKNPRALKDEGKIIETLMLDDEAPVISGISIPTDNDVYMFFYRELEDDGAVLREKMTFNDYYQLKENAVLALMMDRLTQARQTATAAQTQARVDTNIARDASQLNRTAGGTRYSSEARAAQNNATMSNMRAVLATQQAQDYSALYNAANWDFYFEQKELHYRYLRDSVFAGFEGEIPEPTYSTTDLESTAKSDRTQYESLAQDYATQQRNDMLDFFDRLEKREDARRAYVTWGEDQKYNTIVQAEQVARRYAGHTWDASSNDLRNDDWYGGTNFGAPMGASTTIGGQEYVFGRKEYDDLQGKQIGVQSTILTPYDVITRDGEQIKYKERKQVRQLPPDIPTDRKYDIVGSK